MSLNAAASAERLHIGFFGMRNAGKSSVVNAVTGQDLALVSDVKGTTTDPVKKAMELLPLGPVVIIDTPGMDDEGELGLMRVKKARQVLNYADMAILVVDSTAGLSAEDKDLLNRFKEKNIPYIVVWNKSDLLEVIPEAKENEIYVSAKEGVNINALKDRMGALIKSDGDKKRVVGDLIKADDTVVLVIPIDSAAPKGRLILPQQQTIRDILDSGAVAMTTGVHNLPTTLAKLKEKPRLVITDSQAFGKVSKLTPEDIELTSFSILFARYKGDLMGAVKGAAKLDHLEDGDTVLISEGCTHHRQCGDIGSVKLPNWILNYTGKDIKFEFTSGTEFPENLSKYVLVIHCGACMLTEREMQYRNRHSADWGVPMTNYGIAIAQIHGILRRSLEPFPEVLAELK